MQGERETGKIGFSSIRAGGIVGEHTVLFASEDEVLTLSHSAIDRSLFARGAVAAAAWVRTRKAGLYDMQDVLGLSPSLTSKGLITALLCSRGGQ